MDIQIILLGRLLLIFKLYSLQPILEKQQERTMISIQKIPCSLDSWKEEKWSPTIHMQ